jgi:hypothetical protein
MCESLPPQKNSYAQIVTPNVTVHEVGRVFERLFSHESGAFMVGIGVLNKRTPQNSLTLFSPCEGTVRREMFMKGRRPSDDTECAIAFTKDSPASRSIRNKCLLFNPQSMIRPNHS